MTSEPPSNDSKDDARQAAAPMVAAEVVDEAAEIDSARYSSLMYPSQFSSYQLWILALATAMIVAALLLQKVQHSGGEQDAAELRRSTQLRVAGRTNPLPELCFAKRFLGVQCPGCGLTRSVVSTARGDLRTAMQFHPAGPLIFLWAALQIPYRLGNVWRLRLGKLAWRTPGAMTMVGLIGMICVVQWVARMSVGW